MGARIDIAFDPPEWVDLQGKADGGPYASNYLEEVVWKANIIKVPPADLLIIVGSSLRVNPAASLIHY